MSSDRESIAAKLREAREYLGLSQQEVADALKLSRSAVSLIETAQRGVDSTELKAMARLYQRPIGYFTGEEPQPLGGDVALSLNRFQNYPSKIAVNCFGSVSI